MAEKQNDYWKRFWAYYKEAAKYAAFTMPDPTKAGDWWKEGAGSIMALLAAAEVSAKTGPLTMQRVIQHMIISGHAAEAATVSRLFGWVLRANNAGAVATRGFLMGGTTGATGTTILAGEITLTIPGLAATAAGGVVATYLGTIIGCLGYAQLRMMNVIDPDNGRLANMFRQFYGYDPSTEAATDYLHAKAKARSAAVRRAAKINAVIPASLLRAY